MSVASRLSEYVSYQPELEILFMTLMEYLTSQTGALQVLVSKNSKHNLIERFQKYSVREFWIMKVFTGLFSLGSVNLGLFVLSVCKNRVWVLLQSESRSNWTNIKKIRKDNSSVHLPTTYLTSKNCLLWSNSLNKQNFSYTFFSGAISRQVFLRVSVSNGKGFLSNTKKASQD